MNGTAKELIDVWGCSKYEADQIARKMKMDGYDIDITPLSDWYEQRRTVTAVYRVYTWKHENNRTVKTYHYGYSTYKQMLSMHPELKG